MKRRDNTDIFTRFTSRASIIFGHAWVFVAALTLLLLWGVSGPLFGFSDTWQLVVNTSTTIVTFLMVFIIQNTQNRDSLAVNLKLDAVMTKLDINEKDLIDAEEKSDEKLEKEKEGVQRRAGGKH